ncbi:DNA photolyase, FAD-binding/Cryptochrome [Collybia nuda]|uniref:Cryptochrome DASH n=1 Tax=Collybia nuda TaxID=64659 RepID=A0A9P5Y421_9AGAR|nr:DNA photolyase, FAD-binding/Cryptochrome [Collybia nuda]
MYLIYLLRRDLRISDNPIIHALKDSTRYTHVLPLYVISPSQIEVSGFLKEGMESPYPETRSRIGKFWRCGPHRTRFLAEGLWDLKHGLRSLGSDLVVRVGRMEEIIQGLLLDKEFSTKVGGVWMAKDWGYEELEEERRVGTTVDSLGGGGVEWKVFNGEETLIHEDDLPVKPSELPDVFTSFRKRLEPLRENIRLPMPSPESFYPLPPLIPGQAHPFVIPTSLEGLHDALQKPLKQSDLEFPPPFPAYTKSAHPFTGGESYAHTRVKHLISSGAMAAYKDTRNGLVGEDFSTKLSGYLSHGFITARQVNAYLVTFEDGTAPSSPTNGDGYGNGENKGTAAVRFELLWRDYMRLCMRKYGHRLFSVHGFRGPPQNTGSRRHHGKTSGARWRTLFESSTAFSRFQNGTTGTGLIDASMRELALTGYTSNRARQNCASFLAIWLGIDWRVGAEWYESMLVDYDVASNWGNWQYVAGVGNDPRGGGEGRRFNPVKQAWDYDPRGEYVRMWVEEMGDVGGGQGNLEVLFQPSKVDEVLARRGSGGVEGKTDRRVLEGLRLIVGSRDPLVEVSYEKRKMGGGKGGKRGGTKMRESRELTV